MLFICFSSGSSGIPVKLVTNLFSLDLPQDWKLYQYHVTYMPDLESRSLRVALLYSQKELSNKAKAFDGVNLFLSEKLEERVQYGYFVIHTHAHILMLLPLYLWGQLIFLAVGMCVSLLYSLLFPWPRAKRLPN